MLQYIKVIQDLLDYESILLNVLPIKNIINSQFMPNTVQLKGHDSY